MIMDVHGDDEPLSDPDAEPARRRRGTSATDGVGTNNLKYGAAYAPNLETVLDYAVRRDEDRREAYDRRRRRQRDQKLADTRDQPTTSSTSGPRRRSATCR